jgi:hypothetical protein
MEVDQKKDKVRVDFVYELNRYAEVALLYLKVTQIFKGF